MDQSRKETVMNIEVFHFDVIADWLKALIKDYDFNLETLSRYLALTHEQITQLSDGKMDFLLEEDLDKGCLFGKVAALYLSAVEDKDIKLAGFLDVLVTYHHVLQKTIARMAGVEERDIEHILQGTSGSVDENVKYRVAVTVMSLRFALKDNEPKRNRAFSGSPE